MLNKKKYFLFLLGVLLLGIIIATGVVMMTGESIDAVKGAQNVIYPLYLNNSEDVVGFQIEVNYSTNYLNLTGVEPTSRINNAEIVYNNQNNILRIAVLVNNESDKIVAGNGAVLNLIFDVDENAIAGNYTIDLYNLISSNISAIALNSSESDGLFEIIEKYGFVFLPPISNFDNFTLQNGATLPLKFNVTDENGFAIDDSVLVRVYNLSLGIDKTYNASGEGDEYITIDGVNKLYITNIHTEQLNMGKGIYNIDVIFSNYQDELIGFELVDKSQGIGKGKQR
ncbi:MAG: cohesin domain-containing protein [Nanoarchaeota archaeon]